MKKQERERQKVQRLELQMDQMGKAVRSEPPAQTGEIRAALSGDHGAHEQVHRHRAGHERHNQQHVVADDDVVRDRVQRREQHALEEQVI